MNRVGALILLPLLAVLPTHTFTSNNFLEPSLIDELGLRFNWHEVRRMWINAGHLNTEPTIFSYIQLLEKIDHIGHTEKLFNISFNENSTDSTNISSSDTSTNQTTTQNYLHVLAGVMVRAFCKSLDPQQHCDQSEECIDRQNDTKIMTDHWCLDVAEKVEKEPFTMEIMKFLDSISDPGLLSKNVTLKSNSSNIFIEWDLENPQVGILFEVTSFNVTYCPLEKPKEWSCNGKWRALIVEAKDAALNTTIGNLEPDTKYKVAVVPLFKNREQASEKKYKYIRTNYVNANGSIVLLASQTLCATVSALLIFFFL